MDSKEEHRKSKPSSRRRFLKQGAALAGWAAVGGMRPARAQQGLGGEPGFVPEESVPPANILRDPWTGEPLRDPEGNLVVDWTGSPHWAAYQQKARGLGGPRYGTREKDYRMYGFRSRYVNSFRIGSNGTSCPAPTTVKTPFFSLLTPLQDQAGIITPTALHFMDEHGFEIPDIDPRQHRLLIDGMVDRPLVLTMDDLKRLPSVSRIHTVECNSNGTPNHGGRLAPWASPGDIYGELSCSEWTGVLLSTLLQTAGVQRGASWVWAESDDSYNHAKSIPMEKALDDTLVAYQQNGEPLRPEQGFPIRLLTPGWEGVANIKRLRRMKAAHEPAIFHREAKVYTSLRPDNKIRWFQFEMQPKSVILRPSGGQQMPGKGFYEMRGIAWSGGGRVRRVEISTDGGRTWSDAQIQEPVFPKALTRFVFPWNWNGEEVMLASRCTDERGTTQPTTAEMEKLWGVGAGYFRTPRVFVWRFNVIQPWKIDREGRVTNAIFSI